MFQCDAIVQIVMAMVVVQLDGDSDDDADGNDDVLLKTQSVLTSTG